jgi:hypothetical protein
LLSFGTIPEIATGSRRRPWPGTAAAPDRPTHDETMAGHSQFKNIMHRKGRQDAAKS